VGFDISSFGLLFSNCVQVREHEAYTSRVRKGLWATKRLRHDTFWNDMKMDSRCILTVARIVVRGIARVAKANEDNVRIESSLCRAVIQSKLAPPKLTQLRCMLLVLSLCLVPFRSFSLRLHKNFAKPRLLLTNTLFGAEADPAEVCRPRVPPSRTP
jgi:hypothetical protein